MTVQAAPRLALYLGQEAHAAPAWMVFFHSLGLTPRTARSQEEALTLLRGGECAFVLLPQNTDAETRQTFLHEAEEAAQRGAALAPVLQLPSDQAGILEDSELSGQFLHSLIENLPTLVFVKDARTLRYLRFNRAGEAMMGRPREEFIGRTDEEIFPSHQAAHFQSTDRRALASGGVVETEEEPVETRHHGTRLVHTKKIPIFAPGGEALFILGVSEDVTDRHQAEEQRLKSLREEAEMRVRENAARRMAFLAEASTLLASSLDYRATLSSMARLAVPALADWSAVLFREKNGPRYGAGVHKSAEKEALLRDAITVFVEQKSDPLGVRSAIQSGKSYFAPFLSEDTLRELAGDDEVFRAFRDLGCRSLLLVPIVSRGKVYGAFWFASANATRSFRQEDLVVAEELGRRAGTAVDNALLYETAQKAVEVRDSFLSIASHELKTPITSLKLHIQMTKREVKPAEGKLPDPGKLLHVLNRSEQQINRLARLVDDLLDVSRIEAGKLTLFPERVNLADLVRDVVDRYSDQARAAGCWLQVECDGNAFVRCDPFRMDQVVVNLLSNALKYGKGKPVRLRVGNEGGTVKLRVEDNGIGIRPERIDKIFERFERAEVHAGITGLGLGLYIVRSIVEAHGGEIFVESRVGQGSCFTLAVPEDPAVPQMTEAAG